MNRFLHPPRTGGRSLQVAWNLRAPEYQGHAGPDPEATFSYGFTRNPWDRAISLYLLVARANPGRECRGGFPGWCAKGMPVDDEFLAPVDFRLPTTFWLKDADWVGRFESRLKDLTALSATLGRDVPADWLNNSVARHPYACYYDDDSKIYIAERYAEDIKTYGYTFEVPTS